MGKNCLLVFIISLLCLNTFSQTGKLTGKILNTKNEPLAFVSVKVIGATGLGTSSDLEGRYTLTLPANKNNELEFSAVGYERKAVNEIEIIQGKVSQLDIVLDLSKKALSEVMVIGQRSTLRKESVNSLLQFQKNTYSVAQVISAEAIRRSPDKNTGEVLKRIPGTSIQEGKYLVVRGLADRYNQAMLNGVLLSSTEPDRKTFSFDIFPAPMIDNIIINNTSLPEYPGEWAGGLVQVNTKDIPSAGFFNIQIGTSFNSNTIGKDFYSYQGGKYDWLGFDDGARGLPDNFSTKSNFAKLGEAARNELGKQVVPNKWSVNKNSNMLATIGQSLQASGGFNTKLFNKEFGGILALTYNRSVKRLQYNNSFFVINGGSAQPSFDYSNNKYSTDILEGALANFTLKVNANNKISFKNILNVTTSDYTNLRTGLDFEANSQVGENIRSRELGFRANTFFSTMLTGEHNLPALKTKINWYGSFNILDQVIPDQRRIQYNQSKETPNAPYLALLSNTLSQKSGSIYYSALSDYIYTAGGDVTHSFDLFSRKQSIKAGYLLQIKDRLFDARPFSINLPSDNPALRMQDEDHIFGAGNFGTNDNQLGFNQLTGNQYRYMANTILNAGYLQLDNSFSDWLRIVWGVRYENFDQLVGSVRKSDDRFSYSKVGDFLPSVNATFKVNAKNNIRLAGSRTLVRPEFRELTNLAFYDFELGAIITGNKNLQRTNITNVDLRYEIYPQAGEILTIGVFYKYFKNPIELQFNQSGVGSSSFNFINANSANSYGAELEVRKKLDFISEKLHNLTVQGNVSYIYNRVKFENQTLDRPMQGQSPYLINAGLLYDVEKIGLNTTILFNQIGRRILFVGNEEVPAIWEAPRPLLDIQVAKKICKKKGELKLNISDLLNQRAKFYHDLDQNGKFSGGKDALAISRNYGTNVSISFGYTLK
ncbi:MAG: TonB-dependent receptor [Chitinophagaceae bacterium]